MTTGIRPHELVHRELQRRSGIAEQVIDHADTWGVIRPERTLFKPRRLAGVDPTASRQRCAGSERIRQGFEPVNTEPNIQGQPIDGPGVLRIDPHVTTDIGVPADGIVLSIDAMTVFCRTRHREPIIRSHIDVTVTVTGVPIVTHGVLDTSLEVV